MVAYPAWSSLCCAVSILQFKFCRLSRRGCWACQGPIDRPIWTNVEGQPAKERFKRHWLQVPGFDRSIKFPFSPSEPHGKNGGRIARRVRTESARVSKVCVACANVQASFEPRVRGKGGIIILPCISMEGGLCLSSTAPPSSLLNFNTLFNTFTSFFSTSRICEDYYLS
jgi:hypothetical protein